MKPTEVPQTYDDARLAAREMAASPWCAALVRELGAGADLRESLEWIFALAIRAGQSIEETKLEAERIGAQEAPCARVIRPVLGPHHAGGLGDGL